MQPTANLRMSLFCMQFIHIRCELRYEKTEYFSKTFEDFWQLHHFQEFVKKDFENFIDYII